MTSRRVLQSETRGLVHRSGRSPRRESAAEDAAGVIADLVEDDVDRLVGVEVELPVDLPFAVAEGARPGVGAFVADLSDGRPRQLRWASSSTPRDRHGRLVGTRG
jgi:hypothetical protein